MSRIKKLEREISNINARNAKVETDKSWETSWTRRIIIFILTYLAIAAYFYAIGLPSPLINSFVPSVAFVISTLTLPFFKKIWTKNIYRKSK